MSLPPLTPLERAKLIAQGHGFYVSTMWGNDGPLYTLYKNGKAKGRETKPDALLALVERKCLKRRKPRVTVTREPLPGK